MLCKAMFYSLSPCLSFRSLKERLFYLPQNNTIDLSILYLFSPKCDLFIDDWSDVLVVFAFL